MHARHRNAIILGIFALLVFLVRWPVDSYTCNPKTWHGADGKPWRPTPEEGSSFFETVFRGGSGTPAIFAMLGGQRYMIANITWAYSDVLFHKGKIYDMVYPLESTITLNPAFTEAWSTYGWHMAWNLYADASDILEKQKWLREGTKVYLRAVLANPAKPVHRRDLARIYKDREGNYRKALNVMEPVIYPDRDAGRPFIGPLTNTLKNETANVDVITGKYWDPYSDGHMLAIIYKQIGIFTGDWSYFQKAVDVYKLCLQADPDQRNTPQFVAELEKRIREKDTPASQQWLAEQRKTEAQIRENYVLPKLHFGDPIEKLWPDHVNDRGQLISGGETGIPGDHLRY